MNECVRECWVGSVDIVMSVKYGRKGVDGKGGRRD